MKTLTVTSFTTDGSTWTMQGTIADQEFGTPTQATTISRPNPANLTRARAWRLTNTAMFCFRVGGAYIAMLLDGFGAKVAAALEPSLSWAPRLSTQPDNATTSAGAGGNASFAVAQNDTDEAAAAFAWYRSTDGATWTQITGANTPDDPGTYGGYATATLTLAGATVPMNGYRYRCVATSAAGATTSNTATLTVTA